MNVAIIDYKVSNLYSVQNALNHLGINNYITNNKEKILSSDAAILPGVGAFPEAIKKIKNLQLDEVIKSFIKSKRPFMGICLGFQLLFSKSQEFELTEGLDILKGEVLKFDKNEVNIVPHIGWSKVLYKKTDYQKTNNFFSDNYFYFVHSYYVRPQSKSIILSSTNYNNKNFCSSILHDNILACQFHPEKSSKSGVDLFKFLVY